MNESQVNFYKMAERVNSKASFIAFAAALAADREAEVAAEAARPSSPYGPGARGWENGSIEAFLGAMSAWAASGSALTGQAQVPEEASWRAFAEILHSGKFYE
jgi:hypothetical protein